MWSVECKVWWSVGCKVGSVECEVWSEGTPSEQYMLIGVMTSTISP